MREILFRGKPKNLKKYKWVQGQLLHHRDNLSVIYSEEADHPVGVMPETVGQFTGLTDKNDKKIFEGDILTLRTGIPYVVRFEDGAFFFENTEIPIRFANKFSVIGNIHDNPELLEDAE